MNFLPQKIPKPKYRAEMCAKTLKIQLSTWPTAAILNFGLSQIQPTLSRESPQLNFSFVTLHHKTTKKSPDMDFELRADSKRGDSEL